MHLTGDEAQCRSDKAQNNEYYDSEASVHGCIFLMKKPERVYRPGFMRGFSDKTDAEAGQLNIRATSASSSVGFSTRFVMSPEALMM